ncbi:hypothetical protein Fcan01_16502 [Folsomia candida]|uniref:Uncharacterized protein n=1 Tax=Folsomia candida TaxID=158441 RepID=A0A226DVW2_FOLCA|nr:hypothetical protein Fcan01_16502 [Folsomia candida]
MTKNSAKIRTFRLQTVSHLAYCILTLAHLILTDLPRAKRLQGFAFFCIYFVLLCARWDYGKDVAVAQIINSCMDFEKKLVAGKRSLNENLESKLMKLFLQVTFFSVIATAFAIIGLILLDPCLPPFLLSVRDDCGSITWTSALGAQHLTFLLDTWMAFHVLPGGTLEIIYILFVGIVSMLNYFAVIRGDIQEAQGSAEFETCTKVYRNIQILEKMFNGFLMVYLIPVYMLLLPTLQILTQYVSLMMHDEIPMPSFLIFPLVWLNVFVNNIFVITLASWVNNVSTMTFKEQVRAIVHSGVGTRRSALRKGATACAVLKIKFGSNFIDSATPLVIQNFCLAQTVTLILIGGSKKGR